MVCDVPPARETYEALEDRLVPIRPVADAAPASELEVPVRLRNVIAVPPSTKKLNDPEPLNPEPE